MAFLPNPRLLRRLSSRADARERRKRRRQVTLPGKSLEPRVMLSTRTIQDDVLNDASNFTLLS